MTRLISMKEQRLAISDARDFGRVAVMLGGYSSEREVSLVTGKAVLEALKKRGVDAHPWDPAEHTLAEFAAAGFERVWIALHGTGGEDGAIDSTSPWAPSSISHTAGYFIVSLEPKFPSIHSIVALR